MTTNTPNYLPVDKENTQELPANVQLLVQDVKNIASNFPKLPTELPPGQIGSLGKIDPNGWDSHQGASTFVKDNYPNAAE